MMMSMIIMMNVIIMMIMIIVGVKIFKLVIVIASTLSRS